MADIKVKPVRKRATSTKKTVKVKKLQASDKLSAAEVDLIDEEDVDQQETECLLRSALNMKNSCNEQEEDQECNKGTDNVQPIDKLISSEIHNKISDYEKSTSIIEDESLDYVMIGCRFPNGVVICLGNNKTLLRGLNDMPDQERAPQYKNIGFTKITRSLWKAFLMTHQNWPPLANGSVFELNNNKK